MRPKSSSAKKPAEQVVKDIRRARRRHFLAEDKIRIVLERLRGDDSSHAVAGVLFGKVNPGGKLAVSFPRTVGDVPIYYNRRPSADSNQYVEGPRKALFPFG